MDRKEFALALTIASLPGMLFWLIGFGNTLAGIPGMVKHLSALNLQNVMTLVDGPAKAAVFRIDWAGVVNNLCYLASVPACTMRLRDMGYLNKKAWVASAIINVYVVDCVVVSLTGHDVLPFSNLFMLLSYGGYGWLTFARGKPRVLPSERVPGPEAYKEPQPDPTPSPFIDKGDRHDGGY